MDEIETIEHLFGGCPATNIVWDLAIHHNWLPPWGRVTHPFNWSLFLNTMKQWDYRRIQRISFLLWSIWKTKNEVIFLNEIFKPMQCIIKAKRLSAKWRIRSCLSVDDYFKGLSPTPSKTRHFIQWQSPNPNWIKINLDGSFQNTLAAGGFIIWDWRGKVLRIGASNYGNTSILVAEGRALRDGVQPAIAVGHGRLHIEGDILVVIEALKGTSATPWQLKHIIQDVQEMPNQVEMATINHIFREPSMADDWLSKYGHSISGSILATDCWDPELRIIVRDDLLGRTLVRRGA